MSAALAAARGSAVPPARAGTVVGVSAAAEAATRYAAATHRPVRVVDDLAAQDVLQADAASTFVVLPERELTYDAANALMAASVARGLPVGVFPLADNEIGSDLTTRLAAKATPTAVGSALYCDFVAGFAEADGTAFGREGSAEFLAMARNRVDAAVVHSHGNGADIRVGSDVLCLKVRATGSRPRAGEAFLPCQADGPCRLDHKNTFRAFHGPASLGVRLLVLLSCAGFQPHGGLLDDRFQFVRAMLRGSRTAAVVTSTRINFSTPALGVAALSSLRAGLPLGLITLRMNRVVRYGPPSFLCLGDPESRTPRQPSITPPKAPARRRIDDRPLLFAADALDTGAWPGPAAGLAEALRAAVVGAADADGLGERVARAAVSAPLGRTEPAWLAQFRPAGARPGPTCPGCGDGTQLRTHESLLYRDYRRVLSHCARHGVLADLPAGFGDLPTTRDDEPGGPTVVSSGGRIAVATDGDVGVWLLPERVRG